MQTLIPFIIIVIFVSPLVFCAGHDNNWRDKKGSVIFVQVDEWDMPVGFFELSHYTWVRVNYVKVKENSIGVHDVLSYYCDRGYVISHYKPVVSQKNNRVIVHSWTLTLKEPRQLSLSPKNNL